MSDGPVQELQEQAKAAAEAVEQGVKAAGKRPGLEKALAGLLLLSACVLYWYLQPVEAPPSLKLVPTHGGVPVYEAPQIPAIAKIPAVAKKTTVRPVKTFPTAILPKKEQARIPEPAEPPPPGAPEVKPELADTFVVPPSRGETEGRSYVMPDGAIKTTLEPKHEPFFGLPYQHLELEAKYGLLGEERIEMAARWLPVRAGNVHVGLEGTVASDRGGKVEARAMAVVRWEPWR